MNCPFFVAWKWRQPSYTVKYEASHANTLFGMLRREGVPADRILLITDDATGVCFRTAPLWDDHSKVTNPSGYHLPSCYRRLRLFDPATIESLGIPLGERVVSIDLDAVLMKDFLTLFDRPASQLFVGWEVPGMRRQKVLNGSLFMHTAGALEWVWKQFDPKLSPHRAMQAGFMGSDQGYLSQHVMGSSDTGVWTRKDGVLSYNRDVIRGGVLPSNGRVVFFAGHPKPWQDEARKRSRWIDRYTTTPAMEPA